MPEQGLDRLRISKPVPGTLRLHMTVEPGGLHLLVQLAELAFDIQIFKKERQMLRDHLQKIFGGIVDFKRKIVCEAKHAHGFVLDDQRPGQNRLELRDVETSAYQHCFRRTVRPLAADLGIVPEDPAYDAVGHWKGRPFAGLLFEKRDIFVLHAVGAAFGVTREEGAIAQSGHGGQQVQKMAQKLRPAGEFATQFVDCAHGRIILLYQELILLLAVLGFESGYKVGKQVEDFLIFFRKGILASISDANDASLFGQSAAHVRLDPSAFIFAIIAGEVLLSVQNGYRQGLAAAKITLHLSSACD